MVNPWHGLGPGETCHISSAGLFTVDRALSWEHGAYFGEMALQP
jgi:hypothetical protein